MLQLEEDVKKGDCLDHDIVYSAKFIMAVKLHKKPSAKPTVFQGMVSVSEKMHHFFELLRRVARSDASILIRGESGTGKELVARAIYNLSRRHANPFNAINCAALTSELVASELFGHVKGAFTGAMADRAGLFEASDTGTVFLDEIAEIPLEIQSKLLRVLQEKTFNRVGSTRTQKVDVRIISATNKALRREVERGRFREDLMYRVRVVPVFLPRLTERLGDVEVLAWKFIGEFNKYGDRQIRGIDGRAMDAMMDYSWPGNVRELRNNIEYAFAVGEGEVLMLNELPPELRGEASVGSPAEEEETLRQIERQKIVEALNLTNGKKSKAADELGMSRSTLWRKAREYGIF